MQVIIDVTSTWISKSHQLKLYFRFLNMQNPMVFSSSFSAFNPILRIEFKHLRFGAALLKEAFLLLHDVWVLSGNIGSFTGILFQIIQFPTCFLRVENVVFHAFPLTHSNGLPPAQFMKFPIQIGMLLLLPLTTQNRPQGYPIGRIRIMLADHFTKGGAAYPRKHPHDRKHFLPE